jgi:hypothetical protein
MGAKAKPEGNGFGPLNITDPANNDTTVDFSGGAYTVSGDCTFVPVMWTWQIDDDAPVEFTPQVVPAAGGGFTWTAPGLLDGTCCPDTGVWYILLVRAWQNASTIFPTTSNFQRSS